MNDKRCCRYCGRKPNILVVSGAEHGFTVMCTNEDCDNYLKDIGAYQTVEEAVEAWNQKNAENHYDHEAREEVYRTAWDTYGESTQLTVALEEMSEVQKEVCKYLRGKGNMDHLAEELADATIMIEQVRDMLNLGDKVEQYMDEKISRLVQRVATAEHTKVKSSEAYETLKYLEKRGCIYLARDDDGILYAYNAKPYKVDGTWIQSSISETDEIIMEVPDLSSFDFIKNSDDEAVSIRELLDKCEKGERNE